MIWSIISFIVLILIIRGLRSITKWVDYIVWLIVIVGVIICWITEGFWTALLFGVGGIFFVTILFGSGTTLRQGKHQWFVSCSKCGYDYFDILEDEGSEILIQCKRCGNKEWHRLENRQ